MQYEQQFTDAISIIVGARNEHYSDWGSSFSPRLGAIYKIDSTHTLKLFYAQAFRPPSPAETDLINNSVIIGTTDLVAEEIDTAEINWTMNFQSINIALTLFDNKIDNAVTTEPIPGTTISQWSNIGVFENQGLEVELLANFGDNIYFRSALTKLIDNPESANDQSDTLFFATLNYINGNWNTNFSSYYHSEMEYKHSSTSSKIKLDSYAVFNIALTYKLTLQSKVSLLAKNLFDKNYLTPPSSGFVAEGITNTGREVHLTYQFAF